VKNVVLQPSFYKEFECIGGKCVNNCCHYKWNIDFTKEEFKNVKRKIHTEEFRKIYDEAFVYNKELPKADRVLCDVPCSGIGVIRRKPEIRYKSEEEISSLPDLQWGILQNAAKYVKTGGVLIYSTCTILKEENEEIAEKFLLNYPDFKPEPLLPELHDELSGSMKTLLPSFLGSDGFFMAKFRRVK